MSVTVKTKSCIQQGGTANIYTTGLLQSDTVSATKPVPFVPTHDLPAGYTEVPYIESSGTQYIVTNYLPTENFKYYVKVAITDTRTSSNLWPGIIGAQYLNDGSDGKYYRISYAPSTNDVLGTTYTIGNIYELTYKIGEQSVNGIIAPNSKTWNGSPCGTAVIFQRRTSQDGTTGEKYYGIFKLYAATIWDGTDKVFDAVPCIRNSDNAVGAYDLVSNAFFGNSGTGSFTTGTTVEESTTIIWAQRHGTHDLPSGYTEVPYLESDGNQYLISDYVPTSTTKAVIDVSIKSISSWAGVFASNGAQFCVQKDDDRQYLYPEFFGHSDSGNDGISLELNKRQIITLDAVNNIFSIDSDSREISKSSTTPTTPIKILKKDNYGTISAILYSFIIYENNIIVRNFIPASRDSDSELGMYDTVNDVFYTNQGTGSFTAGTFESCWQINNIDSYGNYTISATRSGTTKTSTVYVDAADDYETEFSFRTYLYNEGDECTSLTGGWTFGNAHSGYTQAYGDRQSDSFALYATTKHTSSGFWTTNQIDLTNYSTIGITIKSWSGDTSNGATYFQAVTSENLYNVDAATQFFYNKTTPADYTYSISSISESRYIKISLIDWGTSGTLRWEVSKIWLE